MNEKNKYVNIALTPELQEQLKKLAHEKYTTVTELVRRWILEHSKPKVEER